MEITDATDVPWISVSYLNQVLLTSFAPYFYSKEQSAVHRSSLFYAEKDSVFHTNYADPGIQCQWLSTAV